MVVICLPTAAATGVKHERTATPSIWIVQAPHCAMPQPYLVPVRPTFSRNAHKSGMLGSTSTLCDWPLIVRVGILQLPFHRPTRGVSLTASAPFPKFARHCGTLNANFGNKGALATLWF